MFEDEFKWKWDTAKESSFWGDFAGSAFNAAAGVFGAYITADAAQEASQANNQAVIGVVKFLAICAGVFILLGAVIKKLF